MSRSTKQAVPPGKEYWSSRGGKRHGEARGRYTKTKTHRRERRQAKREECVRP